MNADGHTKSDGSSMPDDVADAWAAVYTDVADKLQSSDCEAENGDDVPEYVAKIDVDAFAEDE